MTQVMMTLWNGNTFHITGPLWGQSISHWWIPFTKGQQCGTFDFFMSAQTSCSTNIHLTSDLRWWRSCDISVMNSWNNTLQRKKDVLCFRPLLYLLKWTRALPETKKYMCETHSHLGPEISSHYLVDGSLELYHRTRANENKDPWPYSQYMYHVSRWPVAQRSQSIDSHCIGPVLKQYLAPAPHRIKEFIYRCMLQSEARV